LQLIKCIEDLKQ